MAEMIRLAWPGDLVELAVVGGQWERDGEVVVAWYKSRRELALALRVMAIERWHSCGKRVRVIYEWNGLVNRVVFRDVNGQEIAECDCGECVSAWLEMMGDGTERLVLRGDALLADPPIIRVGDDWSFESEAARVNRIREALWMESELLSVCRRITPDGISAEMKERLMISWGPVSDLVEALAEMLGWQVVKDTGE